MKIEVMRFWEGAEIIKLSDITRSWVLSLLEKKTGWKEGVYLVKFSCTFLGERSFFICHQGFFDLLNPMIYDLKRSVDIRWLFDPVLHSSLDDLVIMLYNDENGQEDRVD